MTENSCGSISLSAFGVVSVLDFAHSNRCVVLSHCSFNLQFPNDITCLACFHMLTCHLYFFFDEVSVQVFCSFFILIVYFPNVEFQVFLVYFE